MIITRKSGICVVSITKQHAYVYIVLNVLFDFMSIL